MEKKGGAEEGLARGLPGRDSCIPIALIGVNNPKLVIGQMFDLQDFLQEEYGVLDLAFEVADRLRTNRPLRDF